MTDFVFAEMEVEWGACEMALQELISELREDDVDGNDLKHLRTALEDTFRELILDTLTARMTAIEPCVERIAELLREQS